MLKLKVKIVAKLKIKKDKGIRSWRELVSKNVCKGKGINRWIENKG